MTEPSSTGIGGDMFCLFFNAKTKKVHTLNGSGRAAKNSSLAQVRKQLGLKPGEVDQIPTLSALATTVPGAAAGWVDTVEKFGSGKVNMMDILTPAIELGEKGFPVSELSAVFWADSEDSIRNASPNFREMLKRDPKAEHYARAPRAGEIMKNPTLAKTFRSVAEQGKAGFYSGRIAKALVDVVQMLDGHLTLDDLKNHMETGSTCADPISLKFRGQSIGKGSQPKTDGVADGSRFVEVWEHPPNGQGIVALMALGILEKLEEDRKIMSFSQEDHNSTPYLHAIIESLRIAFSDANWWVTDPDFSPVKPDQLISKEYLAERAKLFDPEGVSQPSHGYPGKSPAHNHSDTVYFAVTDKEGNGMSFINSNYSGFGTCIIPEGCGFTLQNRGSNFELGPEVHPNIYAPGKRPYHTIIPGMLTEGEGENRELHSVYGVMGGFMQPQGHVQVLMNMEVFGMNPQQALDAPRICIGAGMPEGGQVISSTVYAEEGIEKESIAGLKKLGHNVKVVRGWNRGQFGRGQIIRSHHDDGQIVFSGGSDPRGDGCAMPA
jgi:gamma-glutamyltranspeptidase / glutathione hydrolase